MSADERAMLARPRPKPFGWFTGIVVSTCVFALAFVVSLLGTLILPYQAVVIGAISAATIASIGTYVRIQRRAREAFDRDAQQVALEIAAGTVRSTIYVIRDAIVVEEHEDEGLSYYLLLDDGRTLFLSGQYLYGPSEQGFPWESFEIVHVASGRWVLQVKSRGASITPSHTRPPFSEDEYRSGQIPADGSVESRDFNALKVSTA